MFWYIKHKTLNTDIWNYLNNKRYFECEIEQVTDNKWFIVIEPNHLNDWFIQEQITVMMLRDTKQCCSCDWNDFCWTKSKNR